MSLRGLRITTRRHTKASGFFGSFLTTEPLQACKNYEPQTTGEKFKLASQDAFDRGAVALAARILAIFGAALEADGPDSATP